MKAKDLKAMILMLAFMITSSLTVNFEVNAATTFKVQCYNGNTNTTINSIYPYFKVVNTGTTTLNLPSVKVRYYFTIDTVQPLSCAINYCSIANSGISGRFENVSNVTNADRYFEISFTSGSIAPNASVEVQTRIWKQDTSNFNQSNDYSFNQAAMGYTDWNKVTGYISTALAWGIEPPSITTPSPTPTPTLTSTPTPSNTPVTLQKLNLQSMRSNLKAIVSQTIHYVPLCGNSDYVKRCFDGYPTTFFESMNQNNAFKDTNYYNTNPAYVQFEFTALHKISKVRAYLGYGQVQRWWVEAADSQDDLNSKTGTYQLVLPESSDITSENWAEASFAAPIQKKYWKFNIKNMGAGTNGRVNVNELEFWSIDSINPVTPTGLTATVLDAESVLLSWDKTTDNTEVTGYNVYRDGVYIGSTPSNKYTDTFLSPGTYHYKVTAIDATYNYDQYTMTHTGNESSMSNEVSASITTSTNYTVPLKSEYKVLCLYYDPIIKAGTYSFYDPYDDIQRTRVITQDTKFSVLYGNGKTVDNVFTEPAQQFIEKVRNATGGSVNFKITQIKEVNEVTPANGPEWMNPSTLVEYEELAALRHLQSKDINIKPKDYDIHNNGGFNYHKAFKDNGVIDLIEEGTIDCVWLSAVTPFAGMSETTMSGNGAFVINSDPRDINCSKKFVTYLPGSVECIGHMVEQSMEHVTRYWPKKWSYDVLLSNDLNNRTTRQKYCSDWERFVLTDAMNYDVGMVSPGNSQVGDMHYPPNASSDYSWAAYTSSFESLSDDWHPYGGTWQMTNGSYSVSSPPSQSVLGAKSMLYWSNWNTVAPRRYSDFTYNIDMKTMNLSDSSNSINAGVIFRATNWETQNTLNGYCAGIDAGIDDNGVLVGKVVLGKITNGQYTVIETAEMSVDADTFYKMKIVTEMDSIRVFVDDMSTPKISVLDNSFTTGAVGLCADQEAYFDNISINSSALSFADTWWTYPDFSVRGRYIDSDEWSSNQDTYQLWNFSHIPRYPGSHDDTDIRNGQVYGKILNNWWPYVMDINHFNGDPISFEVTGSPLPPVYNLKASLQKADTVYLSWALPSSTFGITGFDVYRFKDSDTIGTKISDVDGNTNYYCDTEIPDTSFYYYTVVAHNSGGKESVPVKTSDLYVIHYVKKDLSTAAVEHTKSYDVYYALVQNSYDGDVQTAYISENINPAYIKFTFSTAQSIRKVRAFIGEIGYEYNVSDWWVEAANSETDLVNKTGSYELIVPTRSGVKGNWDEFELSEAFSKKIWKLNVNRTVGSGGVVVREIELWKAGPYSY